MRQASCSDFSERAGPKWKVSGGGRLERISGGPREEEPGGGNNHLTCLLTPEGSADVYIYIYIYIHIPSP